jgi:hypothetical protein
MDQHAVFGAVVETRRVDADDTIAGIRERVHG